MFNIGVRGWEKPPSTVVRRGEIFMAHAGMPVNFRRSVLRPKVMIQFLKEHGRQCRDYITCTDESYDVNESQTGPLVHLQWFTCNELLVMATRMLYELSLESLCN